MSDEHEAPERSGGGEPRERPPRKLPRLTQAELTRILDEFGRAHYFLEADGRPVCGRLKKAHNREIPEEACLAPPMANGACKVHGGKAGAPPRTGRYSRVLKAWLPAFQRARSDQELLDSKQELALMDVAIEKLLERAEDLDTPSWREGLRETFERLQAAIKGQKQRQVAGLMKELGELIEGGATADQLARDLVGQVDRRAARACKLVELEIRREEKVTVSELAAVFRQWLEVLERELEQPEYYRVLPKLRAVTSGSTVRNGGVGPS